MSRRLGAWLIGASVAAAALYALFTTSSTPSPVGRGSPAPPFELELVGGEGSLALSDLRGRVVLVNFWATWCESCEDEMPAMERLYRRLAPGGFELLAISVGETPEVVRPFRDRMGVTFPVLLDADKSVSERWETYAYPESLLVDRDGTILERYVGPREWDAPAYVERIGRLLAPPTRPGPG